MKVLFLDVDGVMNCRTTPYNPVTGLDLDPYMVLLVHRIIEATGCEVVLSSTWRLFDESREKVRKSVKFFDVTPDLRGKPRGEEVQAWLDDYSKKFGGSTETEVTRYAILDDDRDFLDGQPLFKTMFEYGLTDEIAKQVIEYLNDESDVGHVFVKGDEKFGHAPIINKKAT